jgi:hypothetical protein
MLRQPSNQGATARRSTLTNSHTATAETPRQPRAAGESQPQSEPSVRARMIGTRTTAQAVSGCSRASGPPRRTHGSIEAIGRWALVEMRRLLGTLRKRGPRARARPAAEPGTPRRAGRAHERFRRSTAIRSEPGTTSRTLTMGSKRRAGSLSDTEVRPAVVHEDGAARAKTGPERSRVGGWPAVAVT